MGDRLNNAEINAECIFDYFLAVSCYCGACNAYSGAFIVNVFKEFLDNGNRVSAVGHIFGVKQSAFVIGNYTLYRSRTCVYADKGFTLIALKPALFDLSLSVSFTEIFQLLFIIEKRLVERKIAGTLVFFYFFLCLFKIY